MNLELIYDRTSANVTRTRMLKHKGWQNMTDAEKSEWKGLLKGGYDFSDYNRVSDAIEQLKALLGCNGYLVGVMPKMDWTSRDILSPEQAERYISDIHTVRNMLALPASTPAAPESMRYLDWRGANDIEKILATVERWIYMMSAGVDQGWTQGTAHTGLHAAGWTHLMSESGDVFLTESGDYITLDGIEALPYISDVSGSYLLVARDETNLKSEVESWRQNEFPS